MIGFIDDHRAEFGVEPICRVLPIAPSTFHEHVAIARDPGRASERAKRDAALRPEIQRIWDQNFEVYGVRKVWHQMRREGFDVARCTVERLMRQLGIKGVVRGKPQKTTRPDKALPCPRDKVNRQFRAPAPNTLWVSDFTYVSTWQGFVYVAFVIDTFADRIVGWRVSRSAKTDFVLPYRALLRNTLPGNGCLGASPARSTARPEKWTGPPFGPRQAIFVHSIHRAFG